MSEPACAGVDPDIFFPADDKGRASKDAYTTAKALCDHCPVRRACLRMALDHERDYRSHIYGMFGGLTPNERRKILADEDRACRHCGRPIARFVTNTRYCSDQCAADANRARTRRAS